MADYWYEYKKPYDIGDRLKYSWHDIYHTPHHYYESTIRKLLIESVIEDNKKLRDEIKELKKQLKLIKQIAKGDYFIE